MLTIYHTVGLKYDGSLVAVGYIDNGQINVFDWEMISLNVIEKMP